MDAPFLRLVGRRIIARTVLIDVERRHYADDAGGSHQRIVVEHPGAAAVIPVDGDEVILVRQHRTPVAQELLEIPAGKLDVAGESPESAARRECEEEVGMRAGQVTFLRSIFTAPGFSDERVDLFLAEDLTPVETRPDGIEEHHAEIVRLTLPEIHAALRDGSIDDAKTIIGLYDVLARYA